MKDIKKQFQDNDTRNKFIQAVLIFFMVFFTVMVIFMTLNTEIPAPADTRQEIVKILKECNPK